MPSAPDGQALPVTAPHQHLLSILVTEAERRSWNNAGRRVRILDVGCGRGALIGFLTERLPSLLPDMNIEVYGFDVHDHGVQSEGYLDDAQAFLESVCPGIAWRDRLRGISVSDTWPFPNAFFDAVVSNQVLEHVGDHEQFFAETARVLSDGGVSAHLFPAAEEFYDFHLGLPLVHRIRDWDTRRGYIRAMTRLGFGKGTSIMRGSGISLDEYAETHCDYIQHLTNFRTTGDLLTLAKQYGMRGSLRYTQEFYQTRLRMALGKTPLVRYRAGRSALKDLLYALLLRHVSSVTLVLEKENSYGRYLRNLSA